MHQKKRTRISIFCRDTAATQMDSPLTLDNARRVIKEAVEKQEVLVLESLNGNEREEKPSDWNIFNPEHILFASLVEHPSGVELSPKSEILRIGK